MFDLPQLLNLQSTCVTIPERLVYKKEYLVQPGFKGKGRFKDLDNLVCEKEGKIAARAVGPLLLYPGYSTPTIKDTCAPVQFAASIAACSNLVEPDPHLFSAYERWFKADYAEELIKNIGGKVFYVDFKKWLQRPSFNESYRQKMLRAYDPSNHDHGPVSCQYEAFPKVELQYTEVSHEYKDTHLNEVKERQICGPTDLKKAYVNCLIYTLSQVLQEFDEDYCTGDLRQICQHIEKGTENIPNCKFAAADGSRFDRTQLPRCDKLMIWFVLHLVFKGILVLDSWQDIDIIIQVFNDSLHMKVSVGHGELKYTAVGRASGDGWTTDFNTVLMGSYWRFTAHLSNIPRDQMFLNVKGDDVILALNEIKHKQIFEENVQRVFCMNANRQQHGLGQICKFILWGDITDIDFLSCHFEIIPKSKVDPEAPCIRMKRYMPKFLQTIMYSCKYLPGMPDDVKLSLLHAKGCSLEAGHTAIPIYHEVAQMMKRLGRPGRYNDYNYYTDEFKRFYVPPEDFEAYYEAGMEDISTRYNMPKPVIIEICRKINSVNSWQDYLYLPELAAFFSFL